MVQRIQRKTERTPEEQARLLEIREFYQRLKPTAEELLASGEYIRPISQEVSRELVRLLRELRDARLATGLSIAEVSAETGIQEAVLAKLDAAEDVDVGVLTLAAYAAVLGKEVSWTLRNTAPTNPPVTQPSAK